MRVRRCVFRSVLALAFLFAIPVTAAEFYVSPTGADTNSGTMALPFRTVGRGQMAAAAGDTVFIRGGVYTIAGSGTMGVNFTKSGVADRRINYFAYPGETPIFDLFGLLPQARVTGFNVQCSWIHLRGIELRGVQQVITGDSWGVRIQGSNNIIEGLNVHHNEAAGFFITSGANNLILNCDSHHNYDPLEGGGNGDGFGCHSDGGNNVISGGRAYANSDDGFDFISSEQSCIAEKSWSFANGWVPDTQQAAGNGAGFKSGGYGTDTSTFPATVPRHTIRQCVAFGNRSQGFYSNHHPGGIDFFNNTAFRNSSNFDMLADVGASSHKIRNNIAFGAGGTISRLTGGTATFNSWNLAVTVTTADFISVAEAEALAPRGADGSLPNTGFMRLGAGSDLIDKGEDVGLPFAGASPDLGAHETGLPTTTGSGGTMGIGSGGAGVGGGSGSGGAPPIGGTGGLGVPATGGRMAGAGGSGGASNPGSGGRTGTTGSGGSAIPATGGTFAATGGSTGVAGASGPGAGAGGNGGAGAGPGAGGSAGVEGGCACHVSGGEGAPAVPVVASLILVVAAGLLLGRRRA